MRMCTEDGCDNPTRKRSFSATSRGGEGKQYYMKRCNACSNNLRRFGMNTPQRKMAVPVSSRAKIKNTKVGEIDE